MFKTLKKWCATLLMVSVFTACERSIDLTSRTADVKRAAANEASNSKCRLMFTNYGDGYFTETYAYNEEGLVSDFRLDLFGEFYLHTTMEYDEHGRMVKGGATFDNVNYYDIVFEYESNRIITETWYEAGTSNIVDIVTNAYNNKGQIVKRDNPPYDWYAAFEYDNVGNVIKNEWRFDNGDFIFRNEFSYGMPIKDPSTARAGMQHNWWVLLEIPGPNAPLEQDQIVDDGAGGEFRIYDEDPAKTVITPTAQNLEGSKLSWDDAFGGEYYQYWEYENCGGKSDPASPVRKSMGIIDQRTRDIVLLKMPLLCGPLLKQQLAERKAIVERLKR
jgi:hypothetical protein